MAALILTAGWGFAGTGLYAWDRRPDNNIGPLMTAVGFTWFFQALQASNNERRLRDRRSSATPPLRDPRPAARQLPLRSTSQTRFQRVVVGAAYFTTTVLQLVWALFIDPTKQRDCSGCPENPILITGHEGIADAINAVQWPDRDLRDRGDGG